MKASLVSNPMSPKSNGYMDAHESNGTTNQHDSEQAALINYSKASQYVKQSITS